MMLLHSSQETQRLFMSLGMNLPPHFCLGSMKETANTLRKLKWPGSSSTSFDPEPDQRKIQGLAMEAWNKCLAHNILVFEFSRFSSALAE